jgi:hypothetical protein
MGIVFSMIQIEPTQIYPCFYPCKNEAEFESLDTQACELLDFPNAGASDYCNQLVDINGIIYFTVNAEVSSLVDLEKCVSYEDIVLPKPKKIG